MVKSYRVKLTMEEGQQLLGCTGNFLLPEKLGDTSYNNAERGYAAMCVGVLYRQIRAVSPAIHGPERQNLFGPVENWISHEKNRWEPVNPKASVKVSLNEDAVMGVFWTLVTTLHPGMSAISRLVAAPQLAEEVFWPLANKLGLCSMVEKEIGISRTMVRKLELDKEIGDADAEESPSNHDGKAISVEG